MNLFQQQYSRKKYVIRDDTWADMKHHVDAWIVRTNNYNVDTND